MIILQKEEQEKGIVGALTVPIAAISRTQMKLADQPNQEYLFLHFGLKTNYFVHRKIIFFYNFALSIY